ncbi:MFS transporter, partial [Streptomyces sp. NPDC059130]
MTSPSPHRGPLRPPAWAGRNYVLLTAGAIIAHQGSHRAMIAAAVAVLETGGVAGDVGVVAAART